MINKQQRFGKQSEILAVKHLKKNGFKILKKNYRTKLGEIDIIARDKDTTVFVEVKSRKSDRYGTPKHATTRSKKRKLSLVALYYLKTLDEKNIKARFDVVAILSGKDRTPKIEIIKNAFELA